MNNPDVNNYFNRAFQSEKHPQPHPFLLMGFSSVVIAFGLTCTRKITPKRWRESTKIISGDSSYEENIYRRADRRNFTRI